MSHEFIPPLKVCSNAALDLLLHKLITASAVVLLFIKGADHAVRACIIITYLW